MRRRPALPALCAVLVLVVGQLFAFVHQATTRHITCAEHGEELEAATLAEQLHACPDDHLVGVDGDASGEHADCAIARALHQSSATPSMWLHATVVGELVGAPALPDAHDVHVDSARYRFAPKTSPPS